MCAYSKCSFIGVCFFLFVTNVLGVSLKLFYPFGSEVKDFVLRQGDDVSSNEVPLNVSIAYINKYYNSIYINSNGHLSFDTELPDYRPQLILPLGFNIIAAYFADIDTRGAGKIFYRETFDTHLLARAGTDVQAHFRGQGSFQPRALFIATWFNVGYYQAQFDKVNTFQIVIASDGYDSFVSFYYLDNGIQWVMGNGKESPNLVDVPAQAGFDSEDGSNLKLPNSGTTVAFVNDTNVNIPGLWIFHVGNVAAGVQPADLNTGEVVVFPVESGQLTCLEGSRMCHINARCIDYADGFCCECILPYYGNGKSCLEPGVPQRLNGKVNGQLNGKTLDNYDMHTYVVTTDGRAYSAISRVPADIGAVLQSLSAIGGIIGWMFAVPSNPKAKNGYMFTGGEFNRSAIVTFLTGNRTYVLKVEQTFLGHDALNNIRMDTRLSGETPLIPVGTKLSVDDYKENYKRISPGVIKAHSSRTYRMNDIAYRYTWDDTLTFKDCTAADALPSETTRLSVGRNFVFYDGANQVVRFAQSNKVGILTGEDPCKDAIQNCAPEADCIPDGLAYRCVCRRGFEGDGATCQDVDECKEEINTCSDNAHCYNVQGSFQCQCLPGFKGDGRTCLREIQLCGSVLCGENARCVFDVVRKEPSCECKAGFAGDGLDCNPIEFRCNEVDRCGPHAQCVFDELEGQYGCECTDGFSGDGVTCEVTDERSVCLQCDINAACVMDVDRLLYRCQCNVGYSGDGNRCFQIDPCLQCNTNAACDFDQSSQTYSCRCRAGFYGDGRRCEPYDCQQQSVCDVNARCVSDPVSGINYCVCSLGFRGDGLRCLSEGCQADSECGVNAQCIPDPRDISRFSCYCAPGFDGDGHVCIQKVVPCNQVNTCAREAECIYDPDSESYRCQCRPQYTGDGFTCSRRSQLPDCSRDARLCDLNADCVQNVDHYMCVCKQDYTGNGSSCQPYDRTSGYLIYAQGHTISKVPFTSDGTDRGQMLLSLPGQLAVGMDTDCSTRQLYWTDVKGGQIRRANLNGTNMEVVVKDLVSPEGIAIDHVSKNIYYTDSELDILGVAKLDGSSHKTLFDTNIVNPRSIVIDIRRSEIYWTDWNRNKPQIEKANMDGGRREVLISSDLILPNGLALDDRTQQLCWGDAGTKRIECIRTDGLGRRILSDEAAYPFDLTFFNNVIYWSDWESKGIPNVNREGSAHANTPISKAVGGNGYVYGITTVKGYCQTVTNACAVNNGGCTYLCLPTPYGSRSCACPDDIDPRRCNEVTEIKKKK